MWETVKNALSSVTIALDSASQALPDTAGGLAGGAAQK